MNDGSERGGAVIEGKWPNVLSRRQLSGVAARLCMGEPHLETAACSQSSQLVSVARPIDEH